jgi:hypothetical protein
LVLWWVLLVTICQDITPVLRGRWCDIFVVKARASSEDRNDDTKERFCNKIEHEPNQFHKYLMKILLADNIEKLEE